MREELKDINVGQVVGGTVHFSEKQMAIGFDTIGEAYRLKCTFDDCRTLVATLFAQNGHVGNREFDILVRNEFKARGWI